MSRSHAETDRILAELEQTIKRIYERREEGLRQRAQHYIETKEKEIRDIRDRFNNGNITDVQMKAALQIAITNTREFKELTSRVAYNLLETTEEAFERIMDMERDVFSINYEEEKREAERDYSGRPLLLAAIAAITIPKMKNTLDRKKDYIFHARNFRSCMTSHILVYTPQISPRLKWLPDQERANAIIRDYVEGVSRQSVTMTIRKAIHATRAIARTQATYWENRGRQSVYNVLSTFGIAAMKEWITQGDARVRDAHAIMEGETVPINEPFICDGYEMEHPGDSSGGAPAELIYNCRCYMKRCR